MHRKDILETAIKATCSERDATYGEPGVNLACAMELKAVFDRYSRGSGGLAHREAIHMVLTKLSRIACGVFKEDNYVDAAAYCAIAGQVWQGQAGLAPVAYKPYSGKETGLCVKVDHDKAIICNCGASDIRGWKHRADCPAAAARQEESP